MEDKKNLIIDRKLASRMSALAITTGFFLFAAGYFVGKRYGAKEFMQQMASESLTDQIYTSVNTIYDTTRESAVELDEAPDAPSVEEQEVLEQKEIEQSVPVGPLWYAQIASFRRMEDARPLMDRLKKHGIITNIRELTSKSRQGRAVKWFQVITPGYNDKTDLEQLVATIRKLEKINDIAIKRENIS